MREAWQIIEFFYKKVLNTPATTTLVLDKDYHIWTLGMQRIQKDEKCQ